MADALKNSYQDFRILEFDFFFKQMRPAQPGLLIKFLLKLKMQ